METSRRSSKRQQKIPNHFHDSIHDLNKKKESTKNKGISIKDNRVEQSVNGIERDNVAKESVLKPCVDNGCETVNGGDERYDKEKNTDVDKVIFGSIDDDMLADNEGSNNLKVPTVSNPIPNDKSKMSYARAANKLESLIDNKLMTVSTDIDELGNEFVVFDEELVNDGRRWQLTPCAFFVGFKMRINELRYNVKRMWSRYGLKEVIENDCGMFFFKFHHEEGMNYIVRFCNPPLEALTVKGISALASRIRKPMIMDARTSSMHTQSVGRISYARVLIKVSAKKGLPEKIDLVYKNAKKETIGEKTVNVIYDWPDVCSDCGVFGHSVHNCQKNGATNVKNFNDTCKVQGVQKQDEFTEVTYKRNDMQSINTNKSKNTWVKQQTTKYVNGVGLNIPKTVYQPKQKSNNGNERKEGNKSDVSPESNDAQEDKEKTKNKNV
ncbi:RNA-directed DNA polymerase, eukaryota, reverse transcriptase zinc-binding domain protein [Tanacetum coccineum]